MVYGMDTKRDRWLIAMGQQGENFYNDVWAFDLKNYTWSKLETTGPSPPPRYGATGGIYPGSDVFWVTHGFAHRRFDDTWALDLNTLEWKEYSKNCVFRETCRPRKRCLARGAMLNEESFIMFGGCTSGEAIGPCPLSDTWKWDGKIEQWIQLDSSNEIYTAVTPSARNNMITYPNRTDAVVMFGGTKDGGYLNDVSVLKEDGRWQKAVIRGDQPAPRAVPVTVLATQPDGESYMLLYGGADADTIYNDVWMLSLPPLEELELEDYPLHAGMFFFPIALAIFPLGVLVGIFLNCKRIKHSKLYFKRLGPPLDENKSRINPVLSKVVELVEIEVIGIIAFLAIQIIWLSIYYSANVSQPFARALGWLNLMNLSFILLPVTKTSVWTLMLGISFERAIKYHRWIARWTIGVMMFHMLMMVIEWGPKIIDHSYFLNPPLFGIGALGAWTLQALLAYESIRRKIFELFYYPHLILPWIGIACATLHTIKAIYFMGPGLGLYVIDRALFYYKMLPAPSSRIMRTRSGETKVVMIKHKFKYRAGQYVFLMVPEISKWQWHPFSISSAPGRYENGFSCHIKDMGEGTWTHSLYELVSTNDAPDIHVVGPFGSPSVHLEEYSTVLLIAGGIGVTPLIAILSDMHKNYDESVSNKKSVTFIWCSKEVKDFEKFSKELSTVHKDGCGVFNIILYATRDDSKNDKPLAFEYNGGSITVSAGRPKFADIFHSAQWSDGKPVAAYVCGPKELVSSVESTVYSLNGKSAVPIHLHKEVFEL